MSAPINTIRTTPITLDLVHGVSELEPTGNGVRPHRLPAWVRQQFPDPQLSMMEQRASGVHVAFRTSATLIELKLHANVIVPLGAERPRDRVDVVVDGELLVSDPITGGDITEIDLATGATGLRVGPEHTVAVSGLAPREKLVELWLPYYEVLDLIALRSDAEIVPTEARGPVWLHHGSSVSHGYDALTPTGIWPAISAQLGGVELHSLGLGGQALVDPFLARVMRDSPADLMSAELGVNTVTADSMRMRSFVPAVHGFIDTIRDRRPDVPLVLISPVFAAIFESTPGPIAPDLSTFGSGSPRLMATGDPHDEALGRPTLRAIRREMELLVERRADDANLHYLDGTRLYGVDDAERFPHTDGVHPSPDAHRLIGERFADYAFAVGSPFSR